MPILKNIIVAENIRIGIWKITENSQQLEKMLTMSEDELSLYSLFRNETRKIHWLSYRILLRQMLRDDNVCLKYSESGKPYFADNQYNISIAHSGIYSTVIICKGNKVGIDIERYNEKIFRVKEKFLSDDELKNIDDNIPVQHLLTLWAAKEALYKLYEKPGIDFKSQLLTASFKPLAKGDFEANVVDGNLISKYKINYFLIEDYILAWVKE